MLIDLRHLPAGEETISCGYLPMVIVIGQGDSFLKSVFFFFFLWEGMERKQSLWLTWSERNFLSPPNKILCLRAKSLQSCLTLLWPQGLGIPLSMGFSRQESWSGLPFPSPGDLPNPGAEAPSHTSPALAGGLFITSTTRAHLFPNLLLAVQALTSCEESVSRLCSLAFSGPFWFFYHDFKIYFWEFSSVFFLLPDKDVYFVEHEAFWNFVVVSLPKLRMKTKTLILTLQSLSPSGPWLYL